MYPQTSPAIRLFQIDYALQDIQATLFCHRNAPLNDPYVAKLYSQWDACSTRSAQSRPRSEGGDHVRP
jgi:hypothetical protein